VEVVILPGAGEVAVLAADIIQWALTSKPTSALGLATGSTPLATYMELRSRFLQGRVSFAEATAFLLDEYVGLGADHPQSYGSVIRRELVDHVDLPLSSLFVPDTRGDDLVDACARYEAAIRNAGGIDLQLLGIGTDGHLGFNEPISSLASRTRVKTLTEQTRRDNTRFFSTLAEVPTHVVTQGIGTILDARHLLLLATGQAKAAAVTAAIEGPVRALCPASALQLHPHVTVLLDEPAATELSLGSYYRSTFANKPPWQRF
jgi:glucosamine-6-phosphate deaminase